MVVQPPFLFGFGLGAPPKCAGVLIRDLQQKEEKKRQPWGCPYRCPFRKIGGLEYETMRSNTIYFRPKQPNKGHLWKLELQNNERFRIPYQAPQKKRGGPTSIEPPAIFGMSSPAAHFAQTKTAPTSASGIAKKMHPSMSHTRPFLFVEKHQSIFHYDSHPMVNINC